MNKTSIRKYLTNNLITLDGAMRTELEKYGVKTNDELWSANALINQLYKVKKSSSIIFQCRR